jgi:Rap1a immunity proteins
MTKWARLIVSTAAVMLSLAAPALAENQLETTESFLKAYAAGTALTHLYIHGVSDGILVYNTFTSRQGGKQFFCPPDNISLVDDQLVSIVKGYIDKFPKTKSLPVAGVLMFALQDAFPCK